METTLGELLVGDCEHIQPLNHLVTTYSSYLILYKYKKAMHQSGLLLDDNRDVSEACVIRPLMRDCLYARTQVTGYELTSP